LQGNHQGAANAYTHALLRNPQNPAPLLANRAACRLKLGDAAGAREDCTAALPLVRDCLGRLEETEASVRAVAAQQPGQQQEPSEQQPSEQQALQLHSVEQQQQQQQQQQQHQQAEGARDQQRRLLVKLLARRAAAAVQLQDLKAAEADLLEALRCVVSACSHAITRNMRVARMHAYVGSQPDAS
jgi:hypothetical protein